MPDITKADVLAIIQAVVALLVAFGLELTDAQIAAIVGLSAAIAITLPLADARRRNGRVPLAVKQMEIESKTGSSGPEALEGYTGPKFG